MQMNFGDAVVVEADGLADGILRDFEAAIQIPPQGGFKIKPMERLRACVPKLSKKSAR